MSKIKHQMIERREIDLIITKEEVIKKLLATYQIEKITPQLLSALRVTWKDDCLLINGIEETVITDITPEYSDEFVASGTIPLKSKPKKLLRIYGTEPRVFEHARKIIGSYDMSTSNKNTPFFVFDADRESEILKYFEDNRISEDRYSVLELSCMYFCSSDQSLFPLNLPSEDSGDTDLLRFFENNGFYYSVGKGGLVKAFGNTYFVTDESHFYEIPPHVLYGKKYAEGWRIMKMDGTRRINGMKNSTAVTGRIDFGEMLGRLGYNRVQVT